MKKRRVKQCVKLIRSNRDPIMMLIRYEAEKWKNYPLQLKQDIAHLLKKIRLENRRYNVRAHAMENCILCSILNEKLSGKCVLICCQFRMKIDLPKR